MSEKTKKINPEIQKEDVKNDVSTDDLDKNTGTNEKTSKLNAFNDSQDFTLNIEASDVNASKSKENLKMNLKRPADNDENGDDINRIIKKSRPFSKNKSFKKKNGYTRTINSTTTITVNTMCQYDEEKKKFIYKKLLSSSLETKLNPDYYSSDDSSSGSVESDPCVHTLIPRISRFSSGSSELSDTSTAALVRNHAKNPKKKGHWFNKSNLPTAILTLVEEDLIKKFIKVDNTQNGLQEDTVDNVTLPLSTPELSRRSETSVSSKRARAKCTNVENPSPIVTTEYPYTVVEKNEVTGVGKTNPSGFTTPVMTSLGVTSSRNQTPINDKADKLIGKECFGKWSNHFYPGKVTGKDATGNFNVLFFDGAKSTVSSQNIIPISALKEGHSISTILQNEEYKSAMIKSISTGDKNKLIYRVETDDKTIHDVVLHKTFLTSDQARVVQKAYDDLNNSVGPVIKMMGFENVSDPEKNSTDIASSSGVVNLNISSSDTDGGKLSDANDEDGFGGLQKEIGEMAKDFATKGPQTRIKGIAKYKKQDDPKIIEEAGPIPESGSTLFQGKGFILVCAPKETLDKFIYVENAEEDSYSEPGTDHEENWTQWPFIRERLTAQLTAGGGIVYENFEDIPTTSYESTYMISNLPNSTAKGLLCLSVGIRSCNHRWVIRCCKENQLVAHDDLPSGWSLEKQTYIELLQRPSKKPFANFVIAIPKTPRNADAIKIWAKLIENAGGLVFIIESSADSFSAADYVLTNSECPSWVQEIAAKWKIPLLAPAWVKQCLIEGRIVDDTSQDVYQYNYKKQKKTK